MIVFQMTEAATRLESTQTASEIGLVLLESISLLLFPYMITFLLGELISIFFDTKLRLELG